MLVNGIILRTYASGESDLVLRLLTAEEGKVSAIAKQSRKSKKRVASLDIFDHGTFELVSGRGSLLVVRNYTPLPAFRQLREDLWRISTASVICESADLLIIEGGGAEDHSFEDVKTILTALNTSSSIEETLRICFLGLSNLLIRAGFHDPEQQGLASAKQLVILLNKIEKTSGRALLSRTQLLSLLLDFTKKRTRCAA